MRKDACDKDKLLFKVEGCHTPTFSFRRLYKRCPSLRALGVYRHTISCALRRSTQASLRQNTVKNTKSMNSTGNVSENQP